MIDSTLKSECDLKFFHDNGYIRKKCNSCKDYFWTLNYNENICGDQPCKELSFINKPITNKSLSLSKVRNKFISFFEKYNHSKVSYPETDNRCPVIARWRSDIYLTIASIADFQPHVTSGEVPAPANPLVISQPCIRLNDLEEVGRSGRHLTIFEMMGHHAFNKNIEEIYWKEDTVIYCDEFFQKNIGIPGEMITYKEQLWVGGGNAGPCLEVIAGGLEIATLVFMNMKEDINGDIVIHGKKYIQNPLNIVDTGYGLERISWITKGTPTIYESVFSDIINFILENTKENVDIAHIYALADHSKCLAFMLGDGIVPSNVKAGYLTRLIIRRSLRFLDNLNLNISLKDIVDLQLECLKNDFPSLFQRKNQIKEILDIETKRFFETLYKGESLVKRIIQEKKTIDSNELIALYDTHGMPPEIVKNIAKKEGIIISPPKNFDSMIAELHSHEKKDEVEEKIELNLPDTYPLYYDDHYANEFDAEVLWKIETNTDIKVILDKTTFYPDGGGQPGDTGSLWTSKKRVIVKKVEKKGDSIIHTIDGDLEIGEKVHGELNWEHRYALMKHHTGTHVINGALRKLYGEHIWQAGSQLGINEARFDFSHYKSITEEELKNIEKLANEFIERKIPVEKKLMTRNNAEKEYGFRLYQGGVPPGNCIRVLNIPGIDVEACGGTHLNNIKEVEKIKILKTERIQDGINRIIFVAGEMVDKYNKKENEFYNKIIKDIGKFYEIKKQNNVNKQLKEASKLLSVSIDQLDKTINRFLKETRNIQKTTVNSLTDACYQLFKEWKKTVKAKKKTSFDEIEVLKSKAEPIIGTKIKIIAEKSSTESTATAGRLIEESNLIVHIFDGNKITSAASKNVKIDLRKIAPEIGKILGGSGGGKPKLTQSGGPNKENIEKALELAKKLTRENLEN